MIKDITAFTNIKANINTVDGKIYWNRDIPSKMLGDGRVVSFWNEAGTKLMIIPLERVRYMELFDAKK